MNLDKKGKQKHDNPVGMPCKVSRRKILVANWKLHHNRASARQFFNEVLPNMRSIALDVAVAPVTCMLDFVGELIKGSPLMLSAQNVFYEEKGAFTGECSAEQLAELGVKFSIVGHSERRRLFFETDQDVLRKTAACLRHGITPIICVGESAEERENNRTHDVIKAQVLAVINNLQEKNLGELIFAYEPIWAIGTGKTATGSLAQQVHEFIRKLVKETYGPEYAEHIRIIYGGSVTPENIREIVSMPDIDGALVGGASLQAASFLSMVKQL